MGRKFPHEVTNENDEVRTVLLLDVWRRGMPLDMRFSVAPTDLHRTCDGSLARCRWSDWLTVTVHSGVTVAIRRG